MLGPNGSGKSSVFDAFLVWARAQGKSMRSYFTDDYFDSETFMFGTPEVMLHDSDASEPLGPLVHVRTAHRNTPAVLSNSIEKQQDFRRRETIDRMVETDDSMGEHYQRLVARFVPVLSNLDGGDAAEDLETIRAYLAPVQDSLRRVLPHLSFTGLGDATAEGSFYFSRDKIRRFRYENLSGGEKAVFDLLLDIHIAATELGSPLICLDEPEIHLNPAVQASVLTELMGLLLNGSQLWIATHSVGMIRRAFDIAAGSPGRVAFLDFGQVEGPVPDVGLTPSQPSSRLLREAMSIALDDLASLLAPEVLVICEGSQVSDRVPAWDERIYRQIFRDMPPRVEFRSSGGKGELELAASIASVIAPGTHILKLRDRDDLSAEGRTRLLKDDPALRVLELRSLESYLLDDEVLDRRQLVLPVATTIFAGRDGVIIRYGGTVDYRPTNQAIEAETYGRQDTGNGSGQGWDERAFSAQVAERPIAVAGETGASVAHSAGSLRRGVGG